MKSDRTPFDSQPHQTGIRPVQPREPLTRIQHLYLGIALVSGIVLLLVLAWTVRQWQVKTLSSPASSLVPTQASASGQTLAESIPHSSGVPEAAWARGSHLVVGCSNPIEQINPLYLGTQDELDAASLIFESLLQIGPDGQMQYELALDQDYDSDSHQLSFRLRDDCFFQDGSTLTATDVAWTYQLILSASYDGPLKAYLSAISSVTAVDPHHVTFQLADWITQPDPAWFTVGILHASSYPADLERVFELGQVSPAPDGSGPYQLKAFSEGSATLELRPGFAGDITTIEFRPIDSTDQFELLQSGAIDITTSAWNERSQERLDGLPGYDQCIYTQTTAYVLLNRPVSPSSRLSEPGLPDALLAALSRQSLDSDQADLLAKLRHEPLTCPVYRGIDDSSATVYLETARTALAPLAEFGLEINYEPLDWPELASMALENRYDLMVIPAPADEKLPAGTVLLTGTPGSQLIEHANAWPGASQNRVLVYSQRLTLLTLNPHAFPLASAALGWTDRIENLILDTPAK
ncbi:MAG: hypothetical protein EOM70_10500 [Clostridia bacterium]|nr:hypothetical protein [Clostridia bacterium]